MLKTILRKKDQGVVTQRIIVILSLIIMIGLFVANSKGAGRKDTTNTKTTAFK